MARRTRIEYSATHMMSEAQPRLSSTACSLMVNSPWRSNAMGPPPLHSQPATKRMDRSLVQTLILLNRLVCFGGRDCKTTTFTEGGLFYRRGFVKVIEIIRTPQIVLNRPVAARGSGSARFRTIQI